MILFRKLMKHMKPSEIRKRKIYDLSKQNPFEVNHRYLLMLQHYLICLQPIWQIIQMFMYFKEPFLWDQYGNSRVLRCFNDPEPEPIVNVNYNYE